MSGASTVEEKFYARREKEMRIKKRFKRVIQLHILWQWQYEKRSKRRLNKKYQIVLKGFSLEKLQLSIKSNKVEKKYIQI